MSEGEEHEKINWLRSLDQDRGKVAVMIRRKKLIEQGYTNAQIDEILRYSDEALRKKKMELLEKIEKKIEEEDENEEE